MAWRDIRNAARDAADILKRARSGRELVKALVPALAKPVVLNKGSAAPMEIAALIRALRDARNALKSHFDPHGKVDYAALRSTDAFERLETLAPALAHVRPSDLTSDAERTAFFINLYNVLAIHGVLALGIERSVMEVPSFFRTVSYQVGPATLSLDQIENGILRRNAPHPATGSRTLAADSPAHAFAPSAIDPRIHAALVCASTSCPPVGFYDPQHLDTQLQLAAASHVNAEVRFEGDALSLPITFRYYADDWGGRGGIEAFLLEHADEPLRASLQAAFARDVLFEYARYDWSLNIV